MRLLLLACAGLGLAGTAGAAATTATTAGGATIAAPRLHHVSAFAGLPPVDDPAPVAWAQSNALMTRLRGHAGHLRATPPTGADKR